MTPSVARVAECARTVPGVEHVEIDGSTARGDRTPLSDWDFDVKLRAGTPVESLAEPDYDALAVFWDPLSRRANLIVLVNGPEKIDLIVADRPNPEPIDAWTANAETLPRLDLHFWDWTLWLAAKQVRGDTALVRKELDRMQETLLGPLGSNEAPSDIADSIGRYDLHRAQQEQEFGVSVDRRLGEQVRTRLRQHELA